VNQSIVIDDEIEVVVLEVRGEQVRLGVRAPKSIAVHRKEVYEQIRQENLNAATVSTEDLLRLQKQLADESAGR
jgi:carbon storage regulator